MFRLKIVTVAMATAFACVFGGAASATTFDWSYTGTTLPYDASGTLQATLITGDEYQVTSLSGTDDFGNVLSGPNAALGADNILYYGAASPPDQIDSSGIGFVLSGANPGLGLFYNFLGATDIFGACSGICDPFIDAGTFSASPTPVPAALPLFAGGLGFVGFLLRRRKRTDAAALAVA